MRAGHRLFSVVLAVAACAALIGPAHAEAPAAKSAPAIPKDAGTGLAYQALGNLPVLHVEDSGSRIKPFDTFARLTLKSIYGRESIRLPKGPDTPARSWTAVGAFADWPARPNEWDASEILLIDLFDYRTLKQQLLAAPIARELREVAGSKATSAADRVKLEALAAQPMVSEADLDHLLAETKLAKPDRDRLDAWALKLAEGRKWIAPADLLDAILDVDGHQHGFQELMGEISDKIAQARQREMSPDLTPIEEKLYQIGGRLAHYEALRDGNPTGFPGFDVLIAPRPRGPEYLAFLSEVVERIAKAEDRAAVAGALTPMERDALDSLIKYFEDSGSIGDYLNGIEAGTQPPPGSDPAFDRSLTTWIEQKSAWVPLRVLLKADLDNLAQAGFPQEKVERLRAAHEAFLSAERSAPGAADPKPAKALVEAARAVSIASNNLNYPAASEMERESHFNRFAPFSKAPIAYGIGLFLLLVSVGIKPQGRGSAWILERGSYLLGMLAFVVGIGLEIYGFYLRVAISRWAPVTNMYETVIWVAAVAAVLGLVLELIFRKKYAALAASGMALLATILAANVPLMDPNIKSLTPVLRDNYWLTVHVLTIVSSYAAFALALGLGLVAIHYYLSATYRRDVPILEAASPMLLGVPLSVLGLLGVLSITQGWGGSFMNSTPGYGLTALVGVPGGVILVAGLFASMGEFANRRARAAMLTGLVTMGAGVAGVVALVGHDAPAWWPSEIPLNFPGGLVALAGLSLSVMSLLGGSSRRALLHSETPAGSGGSEESEAERYFAPTGHGNGHGAATTPAKRPSVAEIKARVAATSVELDPRGRAMQAVAGQIKPLSNFIYRAMQVGVLLVAAGTILGGVWADVSWGRFWGWDPKEVWALITLLVYLVPLHGRFAGWVSTFGLVASSVVCFLSVLMAWYGVNFVLGVGLHSYGFSDAGGQGVVLASVCAVLGVVMGAGWRRWLGSRTVASA